MKRRIARISCSSTALHKVRALNVSVSQKQHSLLAQIFSLRHRTHDLWNRLTAVPDAEQEGLAGVLTLELTTASQMIESSESTLFNQLQLDPKRRKIRSKAVPIISLVH